MEFKILVRFESVLRIRVAKCMLQIFCNIASVVASRNSAAQMPSANSTRLMLNAYLNWVLLRLYSGYDLISILTDLKLFIGDDPLLRQVYEVDPVPLPRHVDLSHVFFWRHRTRLTIEHVIGQFREVKSSIADCKILGMFLEKVT